MRLEQQQEVFDRAIRSDNKLTDSEQRARADKVRSATKDTLTWATKYTKTFNQHWKEQGRSTPWEPFPDWPFFPVVFEYLEDDANRVKIFEKSRTMMVPGRSRLLDAPVYARGRARDSRPDDHR